MKRVPEIIIFCCMISGLLTSGITENRSDDSTGKEFDIRQSQDTTGLVGFLEVDSFNLDIIPPSSGIRFFRNGIVFLSNTKNEGKMLPKHVSFGTIEAYTAIVNDTSLGLHMLFSPESSFSFPCEAITFTNDFKIMYFTKIAKKETRERIYRAELKPDSKGKSKWVTEDKPLEFCGGDNRYTHPALSSDGSMMIFASDIDASIGAMDLFIVRKVGEKWSTPENLGKSINTAGDECFPYLDPDNNLFFSSDGLSGFGGYDIFTCKFNGETWDKPKNLSRRINSEDDDIAFSIDKTDGKRAFYTKKQKSGRGEMQLFKIVLMQALTDQSPSSISYIYNGKPVSKAELAAIKPVEQAKPIEKTAAKTVPAGPLPSKSSSKVVIIEPTSPLPEALKDVVVFRIQFLSIGKPRKENQIVINGVAYKTFEYLYLNTYRYTAGEFTTLAPAKELQGIFRKSGFPDAFIAAFKNNMRSVDLALFK